MENRKNFNVLSGFVLKILAIVFMTIDHIGFFLGEIEKTQEIARIFRLFGRFSFPLIIFLLVEGIIHSKHIGKYFIRLGILTSVFMIGQIVFYFVDKTNAITMYSPAIDLILTATIIYLLKRKDKWSFLAIVPFAWTVLCYVVRYFEFANHKPIEWIPFFLRPDYMIFGPLLGIVFYYAHNLTRIFFNSKEETKVFIGTTYEQVTYNVISAISLVILTILLMIFDFYTAQVLSRIEWQMYALFAFIPILFYSGKRGYNAKWFQYGCYIYFPAHLILLFLIFALI